MNNYYHNSLAHNVVYSIPPVNTNNSSSSSHLTKKSSRSNSKHHNNKYYSQRHTTSNNIHPDDDDDDDDLMTDSLDEYYAHEKKKKKNYTNNNTFSNNNTNNNSSYYKKNNKTIDSIVNSITVSVNSNPNFYSSDDEYDDINQVNNNNNNNLKSITIIHNNNNNNEDNDNDESKQQQQPIVIDIPTSSSSITTPSTISISIPPPPLSPRMTPLPLTPRSPSLSAGDVGGVAVSVDHFVDYEADDEFEEGGAEDGNNESDDEDAKEFKKKLLAAISSPKKSAMTANTNNINGNNNAPAGIPSRGSTSNFKNYFAYGYDNDDDDDDDSGIPKSNSTTNMFNNRHYAQDQDEDEECEDMDTPQQSRLKQVLAMDALYLTILIPVVYFSYYLPSTFLGTSSALEYWDYYFQWSKYILWISSIILGFSYVSLVTEERSYPFHCRYQRHRDFFQLLFALSLMYLIGPSRTLMGPNDGTIIIDTNDNGEAISPRPVNYDQKSSSQIFVFNYFFFIVPFVVGLHYTYLDHNLFLRSVGDKFGTPSLWKTYTFKEVITIIPIVLFIISLVVWHVFLLIKDHLWPYYLIAYGIYFTILISVSCAIHKNYYLHLHHYFIFGSLIPFATFNNPITAISLGLLAGITVEGCARWSMGWLWYKAKNGVRVL